MIVKNINDCEKHWQKWSENLIFADDKEFFAVREAFFTSWEYASMKKYSKERMAFEAAAVFNGLFN